MAYDQLLADMVRNELISRKVKAVEKKMFGGLAFLIKDKMCINVSGDNLMCRYDPALEDEIEKKKGYEPMVMRGKELKGYCYVKPEGFKGKKAFDYWVNICLEYNKTLQKK